MISRSHIVGSVDPTAIMVGDNAVKSVYVGEVKVWPSTLVVPVPVVTGTTAVGGSSISLPPHQPGDLIVVFAQNHYTLAATAPTKPAAGGTVPAWNTVYSSPGSEGVPVHVGWFLATQTGHTSGVWGNGASIMSSVVFTNCDQADPIGAVAGVRHPNNVTASSPVMVLEKPGFCAVMTYYATTTASGGFGDPPEGYVKHYSGTKLMINSKVDTGSYEPVGVQHDSGVALMWRAVAFEVRPAV